MFKEDNKLYNEWKTDIVSQFCCSVVEGKVSRYLANTILKKNRQMSSIIQEHY